MRDLLDKSKMSVGASIAELGEDDSDEEGGFQVRVSSVLNRQVREYGKMFMFDGREDTCWNSDQGSPQWVKIEFSDGEPVEVAQLELMFQGGFAGKTCWLERLASGDSEKYEKVTDLYPEDTNKLQKFPLPSTAISKAFKVVFADSTDFFGRITVYQMKLIAK